MQEVRRLLLDEVPLIDLRAPIEFARGALPASVNLPIMNDVERAEVGIAYKERGQAAALQTGHRLVSGKVRQTRIQSWSEFATANPGCRLYCFRGGQRSSIACAWLLASGIDVPRIEGGYKRLRSFLIKELERLPALFGWLVLGGQTGTGKTDLLNSFAASIDLEVLANHRGSAFGGLPGEQPTPINFENSLAIQLMRQAAAGRQLLLVEDESSMIGRLRIPERLFARMNEGELIVLHAPEEERVARIYRQYVHDAWLACSSQISGEAELATAYSRFANSLETALLRIRKRLGGLQHERAERLMKQALASRSPEIHKAWIQLLLANYYDPMYHHQLERKSARVLFQGDFRAVSEYLSDRRRLT